MSADATLKPPTKDPLIVRAITPGTFISVLVIAAIFYLFSSQMGVKNMFATIMATAFDLLINTAFFIMSVAVIAGALSSFFSEFGIIALINKVLSPLMGPIYRLPCAAALGVVTTFLSDNPAIVALAKDRDFIKYFTYCQRALLTNLGTAFGMGLIVTTVMLAQSASNEMMYAVGIGVGSAAVGSIISVLIMRFFVRKYYGSKSDELIYTGDANDTSVDGAHFDIMKYRKIREGNVAQRALNALLDGGKTGVELGFVITPGILIICTLVMMLVFGGPESGYSGKAYEGIALVPVLASKIDFILNPLYGFTSPEAIAFPCTAIGAVGAALGMVPGFLA